MGYGGMGYGGMGYGGMGYGGMGYGGMGYGGMSGGGVWGDLEQRGHAMFMLLTRVMDMLGMVAHTVQSSAGTLLHFATRLSGWKTECGEFLLPQGEEVEELSSALRPRSVKSVLLSFWSRFRSSGTLQWARRLLIMVLAYYAIARNLMNKDKGDSFISGLGLNRDKGNSSISGYNSGNSSQDLNFNALYNE